MLKYLYLDNRQAEFATSEPTGVAFRHARNRCENPMLARWYTTPGSLPDDHLRALKAMDWQPRTGIFKCQMESSACFEAQWSFRSLRLPQKRGPRCLNSGATCKPRR